MRLQRHVRRARVDTRTPAGETAHLVAHRVLDFQGGEIEARERAFGRRDIDADRARRFEEIGPARRLGDAVNIGLARIAAARHLPKHPACQAAFEIDAIAEKKIAGELNTAADRVDLLGLEAPQFVGEQQFEPARTSGEEPVHENWLCYFLETKKKGNRIGCPFSEVNALQNYQRLPLPPPSRLPRPLPLPRLPPPKLSRLAIGLASLTVNVRPSSCVPFRVSIAF